MQTRVYVPLSVEGLRRLSGGDSLEPAPFAAYAVTSELRREHPATDQEELEYLAFLDAAASEVTGWAPVVAAADVDDEEVRDAFDAGMPASAVWVLAPVQRRAVASFHVAGENGPAEAAPGTPDYSWYDATELDLVADLLA